MQLFTNWVGPSLNFKSFLLTPEYVEEADNLFWVSLALAAMYIIASVIEIYGVVSVSMVGLSYALLEMHSAKVFQQRLNLIRLYLYFSLLACFLVIGAGVLNGTSYFTFAVCRYFLTISIFLGD